MKKMKKLVGFILTVIMALAMTVMVLADTTITAPADSTRIYEVYQIFTGDLSSGGILSNVKWGQNGTGTQGEAVSETVLEALAAVNSSSNTEKLNKIKDYVNLNSTAIGTVSNGSSLNVPTGYYLIKDNGPVGDGEAYSLYVVEIVGPTTISPKTGTTTSEKKVDDKNDSNTTENSVSWQDSADYDIGDAVPFKLTATIAQDYANYETYKLTFHDKEAPGLTFDSNSVKVYVNGAEISTGYTVVTEGLTDGDTFEVRFSNLKAISSVQAGSVITVEYTAELNENAVIGSAGNKNTMHITYSNNPNDEQGGENGKTPDDTVIVFTYKTVVNKVTENPDYDPEVEGSQEFIPLAGAEFSLEKFVASTDGSETYKNVTGTWVAKTLNKDQTGTIFTASGLDDGEYRIKETTTPAGYNTIADIYFTVTATHEVEADDPTLTALSGTAENGVVTFMSNTTAGSLTTDIENKSGATLPTTGGIGTTIFYVLGAILVIGAGVLLITKKRMSVQK